MLTGKIALVTGGSRGIGRAIALKLAECGADVAILYAGNSAAAQETTAAIEDMGRRAAAVQCDVSDFEQVQAAVQAVKEQLGAPDILVNNAGITLDKLAMRMSPEEFDKVLSVNLKGAFHTIRVLSGDFVRRRSGRIINISSIAGLMGNAGQANYAAAKAGLIGLTKSIARELAPRGITCNAIAPGLVETDMTAAMNPAAYEALVQSVPLKRAAKPEEIAALAAFLADEGAAYITGAVIQVDGGLYM